MRVLVLGGCGLQGRCALHLLSRDPEVTQVLCADLNPALLDRFDYIDHRKVTGLQLDADRADHLTALVKKHADVVIELLPRQYAVPAAKAAIEAGVPIVNTNYAYAEMRALHSHAEARGVAIMPECGFDPGLDLVMYRMGMDHFDSVEGLNSYCGGIPEKNACTNPLHYKISWSWEGVLNSLKRDARCIRHGEPVDIPQAQLHCSALIHSIEWPGLGRLEAIPNGDAIHYTDLLGITPTIKDTGRYTLRWPGWSEFWHPLKKLGFLDDLPVAGLTGSISPKQFVGKLLEPQLQYLEHEKDLALLYTEFIGMKDGRKKKLRYTVSIERDLPTGMMGMSLGVSAPACVAAKMIVNGDISLKGVLSPVDSIPCELFTIKLKAQGVTIEETIDYMDEPLEGK
jgi:saccharopine dehydrogenase-like NADP-dependent oxidoreductase